MAITAYMFEPFDKKVKLEMSEIFKKLLPGNYEIDWEMDRHNMPQVMLKFHDEAESIMWFLKHT
jgi:hypothetical protein